MRNLSRSFKLLLPAALLLSADRVVLSQQPSDELRLSAAQVQKDFGILRRAFTELHPGLYRYLTPTQFDSLFAASSAPLLGGATRSQVYLAASRIAAGVRCGHTWTNPLNQSSALEQELFRRKDKLPFRLQLVEGRFIIIASAIPGIEARDELVSVHGVAAAQIVNELLPYLRADGSSDGKRRAQLSHGDGPSAMDGLFPLIHPPINGRYAVEIRKRDRVASAFHDVPAMTASRRDSLAVAAGYVMADASWTLTFAGDTAVMTIPTFVVYDGKFEWKRWLRDTFAQLGTRRTPLLIIDIRRNEGGSGEVVDTLLSYLLRRPFIAPQSRPESAYERAPYALARYLDTWDFSFFDRTGKVAKTAGRNWVFPARAAFVDTIRPDTLAFRGTTVLLVGPENSSAGFVLARRAKESGAALLIGQATGGNYRGLNGGELAWVTLPNSGVAVDIPLLAWMPSTPQPDAPVTPDITVEHRFADVQAGADPDRDAVRALIAGKKLRPTFSSAPHENR